MRYTIYTICREKKTVFTIYAFAIAASTELKTKPIT